MADADKCDAMTVKKRGPSPVGVRPTLDLGPPEYVYGGVPLKTMGDQEKEKKQNKSDIILGFEGGRPPPGTHAARILSEYNLGALEHAQLHVFPTPGLELQALENDDRKDMFGEVLFRCGAVDGKHPAFVVHHMHPDIGWVRLDLYPNRQFLL